ncbi:twin-arginine translocation signal domain-containing protein [Halorussus lipolyticus]|uniref:twin-arginine translocation signal domain-containing protein n=1 Tax=Halorussus lipolyticus TaxID=3034024 RepID=UPI0023E7B576|nr:twin-arginine translocation signal domain-containing protein [Halorussus sp. DT80]
MTEENQHSLSGESRRSFMKKSAVASGGLALGVGGTGTVTAQDGDAAEGGKALMFNDEFRPGAQFRVVSPVIEQQPDVSGVNQGDIWSNYNTRAIRFLNTNEQVMLFPAHDAEVQQGQVYELEKNFSLFADDTNDQGIVSVSFEPVGEDEVFDTDFDVLDEGGGKALVERHVFAPNALFRVVSGVVKWQPNQNVQGTDIFSDYNTRFGEYLNANDEFFFYPAQAAELERGAVYVMTDEFDITDPEGNLMTVDFDRVDEATLNDGLLDGNGGGGGNGTNGGNQTGGNQTGNSSN